MRQAIYKPTIWMLSAALFVSVAGCEPEGPANPRKERLFAAENIQLKKDLEQLESKLTKQCEKEIQKQEKLLEKCEKEKKSLKQRLNQDREDSTKGIIFDMLDDIVKLREENLKLKTEIEQLKKQDKP